MVNYGPLMAEIGLPVSGIPANFNRWNLLGCPKLVNHYGFRVLAHRMPTRFFTIFGRLLCCVGRLYIHFRGLLPLT